MSAQSNLPGITRADHSNLGKHWEAELAAAHQWYAAQKWACIVQTPNSWKFIAENDYRRLRQKLPASHLARTDHGRFMQRVKSDVDFTGGGFFKNKHFFIAFDAKTHAGNRFPLAGVESHQLDKLRNRARCGALGGVMLYLSDHRRAFFIPVSYLDARNETLNSSNRRAKPGTASISVEELEANAVEIFRHRQNMLWDWLPILVS